LFGGRTLSSLPPFPSPLPAVPLPYFPVLSPSLRSKPPEFQLKGLEERCKLPSGVWGGASAEIEFGAFSPQNMTSGGNNFPENELIKFRAVFHPAGSELDMD